ncbi:hypothetical protein [Tropicimonas sp. IMCC34043]|uniref:hypothetical protein n=1 Tax=Tropicimonas sp. IMCC34043 TaxID=2248760 RepID=UPI0013007B64|nr:hypothetical protein [Tropicimonas sp. IMCC34043]
MTALAGGTSLAHFKFSNARLLTFVCQMESAEQRRVHLSVASGLDPADLALAIAAAVEADFATRNPHADVPSHVATDAGREFVLGQLVPLISPFRSFVQ